MLPKGDFLAVGTDGRIYSMEELVHIINAYDKYVHNWYKEPHEEKCPMRVEEFIGTTLCD